MSIIKIIYSGSGPGGGGSYGLACSVDTQTGKIVEGSLCQSNRYGLLKNGDGFTFDNEPVKKDHTHPAKQSIGYAMAMGDGSLMIASDNFHNGDPRGGPATGIVFSFPPHTRPDDIGSVISLVFAISQEIQAETVADGQVKYVLGTGRFAEIIGQHAQDFQGISFSGTSHTPSAAKSAYVVEPKKEDKWETYQDAINRSATQIFSEALEGGTISQIAVMSPYQYRLLCNIGRTNMVRYDRPAEQVANLEAQPATGLVQTPSVLATDQQPKEQWSGAAAETVVRVLGKNTTAGAKALLALQNDEGPSGDAARQALHELREMLGAPAR